jgi:hypothetical protein
MASYLSKLDAADVLIGIFRLAAGLAGRGLTKRYWSI